MTKKFKFFYFYICIQLKINKLKFKNEVISKIDKFLRNS